VGNTKSSIRLKEPFFFDCLLLFARFSFFHFFCEFSSSFVFCIVVFVDGDSSKSVTSGLGFGFKFQNNEQGDEPPMDGGYSIALYQLLSEKREEIARRMSIPNYGVIAEQTMRKIVEKLPKTMEEVGRIDGFNEEKMKKFGGFFVSILVFVCL